MTSKAWALQSRAAGARARRFAPPRSLCPARASAAAIESGAGSEESERGRARRRVATIHGGALCASLHECVQSMGVGVVDSGPYESTAGWLRFAAGSRAMASRAAEPCRQRFLSALRCSRGLQQGRDAMAAVLSVRSVYLTEVFTASCFFLGLRAASVRIPRADKNYGAPVTCGSGL